MRFGFIKDPHLMFGFKNNIRKPKWEKHIYSKLEFIKNTLLELNIKVLIFSGDVFDRQYSKDWSFKLYLKNSGVLKEIFQDNGIMVYSVQGNHDMFDGHEVLEDTVFGKMVSEGILNRVSIDNPIEDKDMIIYGIDYHQNHDIIKQELSVINTKAIPTPDGRKKIGVVLHSNITPDEERLTDFTYKQLAEDYPFIDYFLCGHYHIGYPSVKVNNSWFINPWNLTRVVRDYETRLDIHKPELVIVDPTLEKIDHYEIPVLPFSEAFDQEAMNLIQTASGFKFFSQINFEEVFSKAEKTDKEIIQLIIEQQLPDLSEEEKNILLDTSLSYLGI